MYILSKQPRQKRVFYSAQAWVLFLTLINAQYGRALAHSRCIQSRTVPACVRATRGRSNCWQRRWSMSQGSNFLSSGPEWR
jgi:hypothetical protein